MKEKPRVIMLSDEDWLRFIKDGGVKALRRRLNHLTESSAARRERDARVVADYKFGVPVAALVKKYDLSKTAIYRIIK